MLGLPSAEVDTPWQHQEVVWRDLPQRERHKLLREQARDQSKTHIVREVRVANGSRMSPLEVRLHLDLAEKEFDLLRLCGIEVVTPEWHTFVDNNGQSRTLARMAIIDGLNPDSFFRSNHELTAAERHIHTNAEHSIRAYHFIGNRADRLGDIDGIDQYIYGTIRQPQVDGRSPTVSPRLYLSDAEPIFNRQIMHV